jgi:hypothetical protein
MSHYLDLIFVGPEQALPILVAFVLWIGLASLGTLFTAKDRITEANVIFGWAIVSGVFTVVGILVLQPFLVLACSAALLSIFGIYRSVKFGPSLFLPGMWRVLVLALPLLWIAAAMEPSQWDEFSHWLPAPKYLYEYHGFPNSGQPFSGPSMLPGYPYGWPFLTYLSALIAGQFVSNVTSMLNLFLILSFSTFALRASLRIAGKDVRNFISWPFATAIALFATVFNPTFIQKIVLTAYSDASTSAVMGFSLLLGFYFVESLAKRRSESSWSSAWQLALSLSLLINLRQVNLVLVVVLLVALTFLVLRDSEISLTSYFKKLVLVVVPVVLIYCSWKYYVNVELGQVLDAQLSFRPVRAWNVSEIPSILQSMGYVAFKKIGFFGPMVVACFFAARGYFKYETPFDRISILIAGAFLGYSLFLLLIYVGHFDAKRAIEVASFWRYSSHNGMVSVAFISVGILYGLRNRIDYLNLPAWLSVSALVLVVILPIFLAQKIRFDLEPPKPHFTAVAKDMSRFLPSGSVLYVMDPKGSGESGKITFYHLNIFGAGYMSAFHGPSLDKIMLTLNKLTDKGYLLVHSSFPGLPEKIRIKLEERKSYLLRKDGNNWKVIRDWPKPKNHRN